MSVMKTSLMIIPMCPRERFCLHKNLSRLVLCCKKDWATLLHLIYFHCLLPVTNYLIRQLSVTDNSSACREYLAENRLSFPSAPRWVRHSYLLKGLWFIPYTCWSSRSSAGLDEMKNLRWPGLLEDGGGAHTRPWDKESQGLGAFFSNCCGVC